MAVELKVPAVGESITEVQIGRWLKAVGDRVMQDEPVVVIETDKASVEVTAPVNGTLTQIRVAAGGETTVGAVIGAIEAGETQGKEPQQREVPQTVPATKEPKLGVVGREASIRAARVMPAARRALHDAGLDLADVRASGPGGRLLKEDVEFRSKALAPGHQKPASAPPDGTSATSARVEPIALEHEKDATAVREEEVVPMSLFRRRIAERLVQAQQTAALLTTFNEVDMGEVIELRREYQASFLEKYKVKLGFMSFFVKAAVEALKALPGVNATIRGRDIVYRNYYDIGVAVGGGRGLVVPVLRDAERLGFAEVEQAIADFGDRAKRNALGLDELEGGTFTISNGGIYGSLLSTPIVNPPQSGILGLHAIQDRPVAIAGQVVVRPMMYVALTYDHRLVDGREAVTFLKRIKECVEQPARILLEV